MSRETLAFFPGDLRQSLAQIEDRGQWPVHQVDQATIRRAGLLSEEAQLSFWDALIVVSASLGGAETLYTEDLDDGQTILGVKVVEAADPEQSDHRRAR